MLRTVFRKMFFHSLSYAFSRKKSIVTIQSQHLMTAMLDSTGFMDIDMTGLDTYHSLMRSEYR